MVHATAIAIDGRGVLLIGASGSGKSDLALRLIDRGATLISDDIVMVDVTTALPTLHAAPNIQSKIEVRGVGIFAVPSVDGIALRLIVDLDAMPERLPSEPIYPLFGFDIPRIDLVAFEASAPLKIEYALRSRVDAAIFPVATRNSNSPESKPA
jgi:serine kinase of HPr protein (carbohydrate metabolism regulator)